LTCISQYHGITWCDMAFVTCMVLLRHFATRPSQLHGTEIICPHMDPTSDLRWSSSALVNLSPRSVRMSAGDGGVVSASYVESMGAMRLSTLPTATLSKPGRLLDIVSNNTRSHARGEGCAALSCACRASFALAHIPDNSPRDLHCVPSSSTHSRQLFQCAAVVVPRDLSRLFQVSLHCTTFQQYLPQEFISLDTEDDDRTAAPSPLKESDLVLSGVHRKLDVLVESDPVYLLGKHWRPELSTG
jgi:hypothetical protein